MKVINAKNMEMPVYDMKDGQIAIITRWGNTTSYVGRIVQRYHEHLVTLGKESGSSWENYFMCKNGSNASYMVKILERGTQLEI
jgi:hypothetical protein